MMKDEAPFLLEWYAHHLAVGFTKILVYTNDCSDGTDDMLIRLEELGLGYHRRNDIPEGVKPQPSAMKYAQAEPKVAEADWILMFDADEFLCINYGDGTLDPMLDAAGDANGIVITWRIFGSGNVVDWSRDPVTEQYLYAAPPTWNKGWGVKTLFKFDPDKWKIGIHRPSIKNKHLETGFPDTVKWLNGSGQPMEDYFKFRGWRSIRRTVGYQWAQMNHYAVKSVDSYAIRKFRGNVNNKKDKYNADYWSLQDRNEVYDDKILRYTERRKQIMEELLTDPVLSRLHYAAIEKVEARLEEYRATDAYAELKQSLLEASEVPITQIVAKPPKARDPEEIAKLMSQVEKNVADRPAEERRSVPEAAFADVAEGGDGFVPGDIDVSVQTAVDWVPNHDIALPADVRIFAQSTLELVMRGKYQRRMARMTGRMVEAGQKVLDLGAGIGFLSIHAAQTVSGATVLAQEDNSSRLAIMRDVLDHNALELGDRLSMINAPVICDNDAETLARVNQMIADHQPDVLRISYEELGGKLLSRVTLGPVTRVVLFGPAVAAFHAQRSKVKDPSLSPDQDQSMPEFVIIEPKQAAHAT
ncbi:glycosyltransferase family 2 protein [Sulfitobacter pontiacus]|jgi:methylase of polypeptide subunit release factors|uniref:glycosyltransferase family 2 protein n=1 Tax=Sulfitobacter pontiacus TaxID=60137 RepID=UPI000C62B194|nr:glycosyltransferase family 2 protein [Sulfitobacter pontiacus]MAB17836.1 glycosyl transferase family 2 [Roseobacter sp.]HCI98153.1 glycosyl transferase family 2 [Sulfitobacter sp.]HJO51325.1 glycosyltransferase family 2 protein [Sulfitobacter pontiacus]|tara:strand:- start:11217 stop:12971 length:1755 start_codon:yes stop_codon:yes gene_type:complete